MRSISRLTTWFTTLATAVGATVVLAGSPAAADGGGYWDTGCDYGHACIHLSGMRHLPNSYWNVNGCGSHGINDYYDGGIASGNTFIVYYRDNTSDTVAAWSGRQLDPNNVITELYVLC
ncbi:hypothetical protein [Streptomyces sp. NPDC059398]|uniref:hypothetical protein n=1 Tax=Streptomyces sp. NPDC059398 TaxID=3346820 RepID=UPI0036BC2908